jgi:hypothetical protein
MCEMLQLNTKSDGVCAMLIMRFLQAALLMLLLHCCSQFVQWSGIAASKELSWHAVVVGLLATCSCLLLQQCCNHASCPQGFLTALHASPTDGTPAQDDIS